MATRAVTAQLSWHNLRRRPAAALLLLVAICTATTTLSIALSLDSAAQAPWDRTWEATKGPDVLVESGPEANLAAELTSAPEVVDSGGPWPLLFLPGEVGGRQQDVMVIGRDPGVSSVEQPLVTAGRWVGDGGVVLERSFAEALDVQVGDSVMLAGQSFRMRGIAITVSRAPFPLTSPGLAWVTSSLAERLAPDAVLSGSVLALRLADRSLAPEFAALRSRPGEGPRLQPWQDLRGEALSETRTTRVVLLTSSGLLALLTVTSVAVLVAGRMTAHNRQVGTLKAVGMAPAQIAAVLLVEHLALAAMATVIGLFAGSWLAPLIVGRAANLLSATETPTLTWLHVAVVAGAAILIVGIATVSPAVRAARHSTLRSLAASVSPSPFGLRMGSYAQLSRLPLSVTTGLRAMLRRPRQAMLAAGGLALSMAMIVAALGMERTFQIQRSAPPPDGNPSIVDGGVLAAAQAVADDQLRVIVYTLTAGMLILSAVNTVIVASFAARDSAANHARLRAIGFTPRQSVTALITSQAAVALVAALAGLPLGVAVFRLAYAAANGDTAGAQLPPVMWLAAALLSVTLIAGILSSLPARIIARRSIAGLLSYE